jgi:hypothetical protein
MKLLTSLSQKCSHVQLVTRFPVHECAISCAITAARDLSPASKVGVANVKQGFSIPQKRAQHKNKHNTRIIQVSYNCKNMYFQFQHMYYDTTASQMMDKGSYPCLHRGKKAAGTARRSGSTRRDRSGPRRPPGRTRSRRTRRRRRPPRPVPPRP